MSQDNHSYNTICGTPVVITDWTRTDAYHNWFLIYPDASLKGTYTHSAEQGLPDIAVSASHGKSLKAIAQIIGA